MILFINVLSDNSTVICTGQSTCNGDTKDNISIAKRILPFVRTWT